MATAVITTVTFSSAPTAAVDVIFKYRLHGDVNWIPLNGGVAVNVPITGQLVNPITIPNLQSDEQYDISAQATCGAVALEVTITTPAEACPNIDDIEFIVIN